MKTITVKIAEKQYVIAPKSIIESRQWREKLAYPLNGLAEIFEDANNIKLDNPQDLKRVFDLFMGSIASAPDLIFNLVCDYAPEIAKDRDHVEQNGFDEEIMEAFKGVLTLVYPFGTLVNFIKRRG